MKPAFLPSLRCQRGIIAVMAVLLLVIAVIFALSQTLSITGATNTGNPQQLNSTAAFFLAESGVENAQAILRTAGQAGTNNDTTCTNLTLLSPVSLGTGTLQGTFQYVAAVSAPNPCGGTNPACTDCAVTVTGNVGSSSRRILAHMTANRTDGVEGQTNSTCSTANCSPSFTLNLKTSLPNSFAFTHLAYNPPSNWGGITTAANCQDNGPGSITTCIESWHIPGTYYNNEASQGVYASVPTPGTYSITESLFDNTSPPVDTRRNYVLAGITVSPPTGGSVSHVGSFALTPSGCPDPTQPRTEPVTANCSSYDYQHGYIPTNWLCSASNGSTSSWSRAATSDTLIAGFGGKPYYPGSNSRCPDYFNSATNRCMNQLNALSLNGQPLFYQLTMAGTQGDYMYSEIWYSNNPVYDATAVNANNGGAIFTGTIGATITGHTNGTSSSATQFTLDSNLGSDEALTASDQIRDTSGSTIYGTLATWSSGNPAGQTGAVYNYTKNASVSNTIRTAGTSLRSYSTVLRLYSAPSSGTLSLGNLIMDNTGATTYGSLLSVLNPPNTTNAAGSLYQLTGGTPLLVTRSPSTNNMQFPGTTTIALSGAVTAPAVGTALAVVSGIGQFLPDSCTTSSISGTTLTVSGCSGPNSTLSKLSAGDAIFGQRVLPNTVIVNQLSGTPPGRDGTYTVSPSYTAAHSYTAAATGSITIIARAAVVPNPTPTTTSFTVSRLPDTRLSNAQLCGGLCPILQSYGDTTAHPVGRFDVSNIVDYDDWSAGFACVRGVNPVSIDTVGMVVSKRSGWSELVQ